MSETAAKAINHPPTTPVSGPQYSATNAPTPGVPQGLPEPWRAFITEDGRWGAKVIWCTSTLIVELGTSLSGKGDSHIMVYWDKSKDDGRRPLGPHPRAPFSVLEWIARVNERSE